MAKRNQWPSYGRRARLLQVLGRRRRVGRAEMPKANEAGVVTELLEAVGREAIGSEQTPSDAIRSHRKRPEAIEKPSEAV